MAMTAIMLSGYVATAPQVAYAQGETPEYEEVLPTGSSITLDMEWSPGGQFLAIVTIDGILIYNRELDSYTLLGDLRTNQLTWSPDGKWLAVHQGGIALLDTSDWHVATTLQGYTSQITAFAWSPDSTQIATGESDGTVKYETLPLV